MKNYTAVVRFFASASLFAALASAQSVDAFIGLGTAMAPSSNVGTDTFGTGTIFYPPRLGGLFAKTGATFMVTPHFGVGGELSWRPSRGNYDGLDYRPLFYDFNAVWHPIASRERRLVPELQAGLGGMNMRFYETQQLCDNFAGCSTASAFIESSNHFQAHFGAGLKVYFHKGFYLKPQADVHYVHNLFQFGTSWVPEVGGVIGYTFGGR